MDNWWTEDVPVTSAAQDSASQATPPRKKRLGDKNDGDWWKSDQPVTGPKWAQAPLVAEQPVERAKWQDAPLVHPEKSPAPKEVEPPDFASYVKSRPFEAELDESLPPEWRLAAAVLTELKVRENPDSATPYAIRTFVRRMPFGRSVFGALEKRQYSQARKAVASGKATPEDYAWAARSVVDGNEEERKTTLQQIGDGISVLPAFLIELGLTSGAATVGGNAAKALAASQGLGRTGQAASAFVGGSMLQAAANPQMVLENAAAAQIGDVEAQGDGEVAALVVRDTGAGPIKALLQGYGDTLAEIGSERAGQVIWRGLGQAGKQIAPKAAERLGRYYLRWKATYPGASTDQFIQHIQDPGTEFLEERLADVAGATIGSRDDFGLTGKLATGDFGAETQKQLAVEAGVLMPLGVAGVAARAPLIPRRVARTVEAAQRLQRMRDSGSVATNGQGPEAGDQTASAQSPDPRQAEIEALRARLAQLEADQQQAAAPESEAPWESDAKNDALHDVTLPSGDTQATPKPEDHEITPGVVRTYEKGRIPKGAKIVGAGAQEGQAPYWDFRPRQPQQAPVIPTNEPAEPFVHPTEPQPRVDRVPEPGQFPEQEIGQKPETAKQAREFSSTQVNLPKDVASKVLSAGKLIADADLADDGRETEPHVTVKYGLHTDSVDDVRKIVEQEPPIRVRIGKTSIFPASETGEYDVVKADVDSKDLERINKKIADALPHTDTHPTYQPHVTLAYVKPGAGAKYAGMSDLEGTEIVLDRLVFSDKSRKHIEIPLRGIRGGQQKPAVQPAPVEAASPARPAIQRPIRDGDVIQLPDGKRGFISKIFDPKEVLRVTVIGARRRHGIPDETRRIPLSQARHFEQPVKVGDIMLDLRFAPREGERSFDANDRYAHFNPDDAVRIESIEEDGRVKVWHLGSNRPSGPIHPGWLAPIPSRHRFAPPGTIDAPPPAAASKRLGDKKPEAEQKQAVPGEAPSVATSEADTEATDSDREPITHDVTFDTLRIGRLAKPRKDGRATAPPLLKEFAATTAEFRYDPTLLADKDGKLVFRDGYKFVFEPEAFGLGPVVVGVDKGGRNTLAPRVKPGDKVKVDLASIGIKPATEQEVVADALEAQGFSNVKTPKDGKSVTAVWKGMRVVAKQVGPETWRPTDETVGEDATIRVNETLARIRWQQPGDPNAGPSKGKDGPSAGGSTEAGGSYEASKRHGPQPKGVPSWMEDMMVPTAGTRDERIEQARKARPGAVVVLEFEEQGQTRYGIPYPHDATPRDADETTGLAARGGLLQIHDREALAGVIRRLGGPVVIATGRDSAAQKKPARKKRLGDKSGSSSGSKAKAEAASESRKPPLAIAAPTILKKATPTTAKPGSNEKLEEMRRRFERGEEIFADDDQRYMMLGEPDERVAPQKRLDDKNKTPQPSEPAQDFGEPSGATTKNLGSRFSEKVPINLDAQSLAKRKVSARDIVATLARDFGTTLKYGRVPPPAAGIYRMYSEVARVRGGEMASLSVETHELVHDVDKQTEIVSEAVGGLDRPRWMRLVQRAENQASKFRGQRVLDRWADKLASAGAPPAVVDAARRGDFAGARAEIRNTLGAPTQGELDRTAELEALDYVKGRGDIAEGFAEFARNWLTTDMRDEFGNDLAPKMTVWFEREWLPEHPKYDKAFRHGRDLIREYRKMTAEERAQANKAAPGSSPKPLDVPAAESVREFTGDALDRLQFELSDRFNYLEKLEHEAGEKGLVRGELDNTVTEVARWGDLAVLNEVKSSILGDGIRTIGRGKRRQLSKSLMEVFQPLRDSGLDADEWDNYHVARHVLEIAEIAQAKNLKRIADGKQPIQYNPGMRYEDAEAIVDRVEDDHKKHSTFEKVSEDFSAFRDAILDMRAEAGEITQDLADKLKDYYRKHASLRRVHPRSLSERLFGRGGALNVGGRVQARSAAGSGLPIMAQIDAVQMDLANAYHGAMVHVLKQSILNTVVKNEKLGFRGVEGMGHWADVVDPKTKPNTFTLEDILSQLVRKNVVEKDDADLFRIVDRLRNGNLNASDLEALETRYGTADLKELLKKTRSVPSLDDLLVTYRPDFRPSEKEYIERLMVNGNPVLVEWNPHIYETFQTMGPMALNAFERTLAGIGDTLRTGATGLNLVFGAHQPLADFLAYQFQAEKASVGEAAIKPFAMAGKIALGIVREVAGAEKAPSLRLLDETYGSLFEDFAPDATGAFQLRGKLFAKNSLTRLVRAASRPGNYGRIAHNAIRRVGNALAAMDLPSRLAEGVALLERAGYIEKKDEAGKLRWYNTRTSRFEEPPIELQRKFLDAVANATVSFRRAGRTTRYVNRVLFPYLNASIQGALRMARTIKAAAGGDRRALAGLVAGTAAVGAMTVLMRMLTADDDEQEEKEQFYKSSNWSTRWFRLRKPQSWSWVPNTIEATLDAVSGDQDSVRRYAAEELRQQSYFELPFLDEDPILGNVSKVSALGPLSEAVANRNTHRNRPIESKYMLGLPHAQRFDARTSTVAKMLGQVTGPGLGIGPKKVEHIVDRTTGGLLTRSPLKNPFKPYETSVSNREMRQRYEVLEARRSAHKYHGTPWTAEDEREYDRLDRVDRIIPKIYKLMDGKSEAEQDDLHRLVVGLSRFALGKAPLEAYPDPFSRYDEAPPEIRKEVDSYVQSLAGKVLAGKPTGVTPREAAAGLTKDAKIGLWEAERHAAKDALLENPLGREAVLGIVRSWVVSDLKGRPAEIEKMRLFRSRMNWQRRLGE